MSDLRFVGDMSVWLGMPLALLAAGLAWWMYRREVARGVSPHLVWILPALRAAAVFLIVMMLTGPVLHHRQVLGELGRVLLFVDASKSMSVDDGHLDAGRKLLIAQQRGWIPPGTIDTSLYDIGRQLAAAQQLILPIRTGTPEATPLKEAATAFAAALGETHAALAQLGDRTLPAAPAPRGSITREIWRDLSGNSVDQLTRRDDLLNDPAERDALTQFQTASNLGDNYAQRIRGYVHPPTTGNYVFLIASDDESQLWLSPSDDPAAKRLIARFRNSTQPGRWPEGDNRSEPIHLEAGQRYYLEALHKEGSGEDWVGVGWTMPDGTVERPIPGTRLSPFAGAQPRSAAVLAARFEADLLKPVQGLASRPFNEPSRLEDARQRLLSLAAAAGEIQQQLDRAFAVYGKQLVESGDRVITSAVDRFDGMSRFNRVEAMLLEPERGLLAQLEGKHHIELVAARGEELDRLWNDTDAAGVPDQLAIAPDATNTDLVTGIRQRMTAVRAGSKAPRSDALTPRAVADDASPAERTAVVLVSDGQHNQGPSPLQLARLVGNQQVPLYTLGLGSAHPPHDLALLRVQAPDSVAKTDRVRGEIVLKDFMPAGQAFTVRIAHEGKNVWEQSLVTQGGGLRRIPFDFPIEQIVDARIAAADRDVTIMALPLSMQVSVTALEAEARDDNNSAPLHFRATTQQWKMLIVDGRGRWETRYIRNLFQRDARWTVNTILAGPGAARDVIPRGEGEGMFPSDRQSLFTYDVIMLGDISAKLLNEQELTWIRQFIEHRAGGLVLVDGQRQHLQSFVETPVASLIPVQWESAGSDAAAMPEHLALTEVGRQQSALTLASDRAQNAALWQALPAPHWVANVQVPTGAGEILAEAAMEGDRRVPVLVQRRVGAGKVLYVGTDETWRWRYNVADQYYARFWHQLAGHVMESPYAVADQFVSIDPGAMKYQPGESASLRVRLRDGEGKPVVHATAEAVIKRAGQQVATVMLEADPNQGGVFRGQAPTLSEGEYDVSVRVTGFPENQLKAQTRFVVEPLDTGEMGLLVCNDDLLRQMAELSGGQYLPEEQAHRLPELLEPLSAGRVVESETALWQSYAWFVPIVALLSLEWFLRKRSGML